MYSISSLNELNVDVGYYKYIQNIVKYIDLMFSTCARIGV